MKTTGAPDREAERWRALAARQPALSSWIRSEAARIADSLPPPLRFTDYLRFFETGERFEWENAYYARRRELGILALAERLGGTGDFLPVIADRMVQITEEHSWCIPAAACFQSGQKDDVPTASRDVPGAADEPFPDLMACETAAALADVITLVGLPLAGISKDLPALAKHAARRQAIRPFVSRNEDSIPWMTGKNNWAPWCAASLLIAASVFADNEIERNAVIAKATLALARYLENLPPDGYCEEGPSYAQVSLRSITYAAEALERMGAAHALWQSPKLSALADAYVHTHLGGSVFANYADAFPVHRCQAAAMFRLGQHLRHPGLCALASHQARRQPIPPPTSNAGDLLHLHRQLLWMPTEKLAPRPSPLSANLPHSQFAVLRSRHEPDQGFACSIKGGHNAASHNHNDLGHVIVARDGRPILCDIGPEAYYKDSWGEQRYEHWTLRGSAHNAPIVNSHEQEAGSHRVARDWVFCDADIHAEVSLDLAPAYSDAAHVQRLRRTLIMNRNAESIEIRDELQATPGHELEQIVWTFYSPEEPALDGERVLSWPASDVLLICSDGSSKIQINRVALTDPWLAAAWGDCLWKITVIATPRSRTFGASFTVLCTQ